MESPQALETIVLGSVADKYPKYYGVQSGKVRDVVDLNDVLLLVATDRISAFDVVMPTLIPGRGQILTELSLFWFDYFDRIPNHLITTQLSHVQSFCFDRHIYYPVRRAMLCKKARVLPIEFVVRGYLAGAAWTDYQQHPGKIWEQFIGGKKQNEELDNPVLTPTTKATMGHDTNISFDKCISICEEFCDLSRAAAKILMKKLELLSYYLYDEASDFLIHKGIVLADTKFEFGFVGDELVLVDELLTPDSSRFWLLKEYDIGRNQDSFDKQVLRDYLQGLVDQGVWDKSAPAPELPDEIVQKVADRYDTIATMIMS